MAKKSGDVSFTEYALIRPNVLRSVRRMLDNADVSASEVSRRIGRTSGYMGSMIYNGTVPRTDLFVSIANACGYDVIVRGHGEEWSLTPTPGTIVLDPSDDSA